MKSFKQWCLEGAYNTLLELYENTESELKSNQIAFASSKTVNLKCKKCDIEWKEQLYRITQRTKKECPYCNHTRPSKKYNVVAEIPILEKEWSSKNTLTPDNVTMGSGYKAKWICSKCNKEYIATIYSRIIRKSNCPFCSNRKVCKENSLAEYSNKFVKEWNYQKNDDLLPENLQNQMLRVAVYSNLIIDNWTERNVSKMKIGIDLDGVVFDSEKEFRVYSELYDMIDLKQNSKINNKEIKFQNRFKWTKEEIDNFISKYHKQIIEESNFMPGVKRILNLLKGEGHNLIIVTARGGINKDMIKITENILKENNLDIFDKYYWATENKDEVCKKENIDIMVDDSLKQCKSIANAKIRVIYLKDAPSYDIEENEYIKVLYNWGEIYRYIKEIENK